MRAIIFDFDGTLANSFDYVLEFLLNKAKKPNNFTVEERAHLRELSIKNLAVAVGVPRWRLPLTYFEGKNALTRHMRHIPPFPGMPGVLETLHQAGYPMYIISSNSRRNISHFLTEHGLGGYFKRVYGNTGWFGKAPILRRTLRRNKLDSETTVYVGDEARDVLGAKLVGLPCIAVGWGFSSNEQLLRHAPMVLVHKPAELQKVLIEWGKTI